MSFPQNKQYVLLWVFCVLFSASAFSKDKWRPVSTQELQMTKGKVEADADAEAIFWEVEINDVTANLVMNHYIRVKVLTERGREAFSKVEIPYRKGIKIKDIEARVTKPDGSSVEIAKDDIFDQEIVKADDVKVKAKSFAVPNVEAGVVVEYRYKEIHKKSWANNLRMEFQREIPVQYVKYRFKPYQNARILNFNVDAKFVKDKGSWYKIELDNMPALKEEPNMPPEDQVRSWLLIYYTSKRGLKYSSSDFWSRVGGAMVEIYDIKDTLKPGKKMKAAAAEITAGASTDEEKVRKLFDFCKSEIRNLSFDTSLTEEELDKIKVNKSDFDTYKKKQGRASEINKLFASLADASGLDTRIAFTGDRSKLFFNVNRTHVSFIHMAGIAIQLNNRWQYFDPGSPFLPYKSLAWFEQGVPVFLLAYKDYITTETAMPSYRDSSVLRSGQFKLLEDGTLKGSATVEYTGHFSYRHKMVNYDSSQNAREERLKERIAARLSTAEVSNIQIVNVTDHEKPFTYKYEITVPNYAQKVGKRMFLQPGFFAHGTESRFASSDRKHDVYFQFPWSEREVIEIELPEGYELDNAETLEPIKDNQNIGFLDIKTDHNKGTNKLVYNRDFYFGRGGYNLFRVGTYAALKGLFDQFHKNDTHTITLKKEATP